MVLEVKRKVGYDLHMFDRLRLWWNRIVNPEPFQYRCFYCKGPTTLGPYTLDGILHPACCGRDDCLANFANGDGHLPVKRP